MCKNLLSGEWIPSIISCRHREAIIWTQQRPQVSSRKCFTCVRVLYSHLVGWFDLIKLAVLLASWRNGWSSGKYHDSKSLRCCFKKVGHRFRNKCSYKQILKWVEKSSSRLLQRLFKCFLPSVYLWKKLIKWNRNLAFVVLKC